MNDTIYKDKIGNTWYLRNAILHREDGPAIVFIGGDELYYLNGVNISKERFIEFRLEQLTQ